MRHSVRALGAYTVIAVVMTWPLARAIGRNVAWDLGDSVLNMWILSWDCEQFRAILGGDFARVRHFFDANIFYPAPLTLAYSEHLVAQAVQIFPIYALTRNPILAYNILFLSTFVLSGLGTYLLVRELTGNSLAGFMAGLLFGFALYRIPQSSHLQVLSAQWMPFTLYGFRRYFDTRRLQPLIGGSVALSAQNLSCGYYLLYFPPFVVAFVLWEMARRGLIRNRRVWTYVSIAAIFVLLVTAPFVVPYARLRSQLYSERSLAEVSRYSADVYSYATASPALRLWGKAAQAYPKSEGELFPGVVPLLLALVGLFAAVVQAARVQDERGRRSRAPTWLLGLLVALAIAHLAGAISVITLRRLNVDSGWFVLRMGDANQLLLRASVALAAVLAASPTARKRTAMFLRSYGFFLLLFVATIWLSLGPAPRALGRPIDLASPYRAIFENVPGFEGLRVPARFAMIGLLMLAVLGGWGTTVLLRHNAGRYAVGLLAVVFLAEGTTLPFQINAMTPVSGFNTPDARLFRPARAPDIYKEFARQPRDSVLAELPIGPEEFDLRAMFYSTVHWRPIVNGYSGFFPPYYGQLTAALTDIPRHAEISRDALMATGVTHVIIHEGAYLDAEGRDTTSTLRGFGAVEIYRDGSDVLLALPH